MAEGVSHALVTGGAGFVGSRLARALIAAGRKVTVLDDLSVGSRAAVPEGARLVAGDVRDGAALAQALEGADGVFHLAAKVSIRASVATFHEDADVNLMGTLALIRALEGSAVRRVVLASSMAVYPDRPAPVPIAEDTPLAPLSPYGTAKMAAERYLVQMGEAMGFDALPVRLFNVYGPGQTYTPYVGVITIFANRLTAGKPPVIFGDGGQVRDFVHVDDVVRGLMAVMERGRGGRVYNIGSGAGRSVREVAQAVIDRIAPGTVPLHAPLDRIETRNSVADISRAREELAYAPQADFARDVGPVIDGIVAGLG